MIGAMDADGKGYVRRSAPRGETENAIRRKFANASSYAMTYEKYGRMPEANKRPPKPFVPGQGKIDGKTAYQATFSNNVDESYKERFNIDKKRVAVY